MNGPSIVEQIQKTAQLVGPNCLSIWLVGHKEAWLVRAAMGNQHLKARHVPLAYNTGEDKATQSGNQSVWLSRQTAMLDCIGQRVGMACSAKRLPSKAVQEELLTVQLLFAVNYTLDDRQKDSVKQDRST
jgi:hypothetical protein